MRHLVGMLALVLCASGFFGVVEAQAGPALDEALQVHCAKATCTIRNNPGGDVQLFQAAAQEVLDEGKRLVIDGFCASACVVLADIARANTCITSDAQMAVHKASIIRVTGKTVVDGREVPTGRLLRREDPPDSDDINEWVNAHGGYPTKGVKIIPVKDARQFWPMCK
jgi:hypothetical protein